MSKGHAGDQTVLEAQTVCRGKHCWLPVGKESPSVDRVSCTLVSWQGQTLQRPMLALNSLW